MCPKQVCGWLRLEVRRGKGVGEGGGGGMKGRTRGLQRLGKNPREPSHNPFWCFKEGETLVDSILIQQSALKD